MIDESAVFGMAAYQDEKTDCWRWIIWHDDFTPAGESEDDECFDSYAAARDAALAWANEPDEQT